MPNLTSSEFHSFLRQLDSQAVFSIESTLETRQVILVVVPDALFAPAREILDKFQQYQKADAQPWDLVELESLGYVEKALELGLPDVLLKFTTEEWGYHFGNKEEYERLQSAARSGDAASWNPHQLMKILEENLHHTCRDLDIALASLDRALSRDLYLRAQLACLADEPDLDRSRWIQVITNYQNRLERLEDTAESERMLERMEQWAHYRLDEQGDEKLAGLCAALGLHYKHRSAAE